MEIKRSLREPRQDCRAAKELFAPLNRSENLSQERRYGPLYQRALLCSLHGKWKRNSRKNLALLEI